MTDLTNPIYSNDDAARQHLEAVRWPDGPYCPHCGEAENVVRLDGAAGAAGLLHCRSCRKKFSVTVGSVYERSHIPLHKWVLATHLMAASKKGISAHQLHRMLGITYKSAWFMAHRIREAMSDNVASAGPLGGTGKVVEADETYFGKRDTPAPSPSPNRHGRPFTKGGRSGPANKRAVVALVERGGKVRSFHVKHATAATVRELLVRNVSRDSALYTDESRLYTKTGAEFGSHETVKHSAGEYVRGKVHTNTAENVFSVFKRGMTGVYQHCAEKHLHRYLSEFDFRYNRRNIDDDSRALAAIKGSAGKRLTYRRTSAGEARA